jgi:replicative DNA helicase Mcm
MTPINSTTTGFINLSIDNYFNDFFEEKIYKKDWDKITDKEIIREDFLEFVNNIAFTDKLRIACYKKEITIQNLNFFEEKSENYLKRIVSQLNKDLHLNVTKINNLNHYTTSNKGLKILITNISKFFRENKYIKNATKHNLDSDINSKELIKAFSNYFSNFLTKEIKQVINEDLKSINISITDILEYDFKLVDAIIENPTELISIIETTLGYFTEDSQNQIKIRFTDLTDSQKIQIGSHREKHINKLVSFEGIIRRKSDVKPRLKSIEYLCTNPSCQFSEDKIIVPQFEDKQKILKCCPKCKSSLTEVNKNLDDSMILILEQDFGDRNTDYDTKKIHIKIDSDLTDLAKYNKLKISSKVKIIGILKLLPKTTKNGVNSINYDYILEANNIIFINDEEDLTLTKEDIAKFKLLKKDKNFFKDFSESYLPKIFDNEEIKQAMILQHIGSSFENERNDSHILLLGDPSTAKTEMISESLTYNTRYVYASGTSSSKAGMTATAIKDELTGAWVLEPGVLPRANGGIAGLDEMDKLNRDDEECMTEALEQQRISVNKANISTQLQTKCSFLAGANPKFSRFDDDIEITKQINFKSALLSRFDLIFLIRDKADELKDYKLIKHMFAGHTEQSQEKDIKYDKEFIKKYIYYCKNNFKPKLSKEVIELIASYYVQIRKSSSTNQVINFTPRQIKGVTRFACAYAKFNQTNTITKEHIKYSFDLFNFAFEKLGLSNINAIEELEK